MSKILLLFTLLCLSLQPVWGQTLLMRGSFDVPKAVAVGQDVQGNLYLATQQGQVQQFSPNGQKGGTFSPDELLYISSLQVLPGMQLLLFDKTSQQLHWVDRQLTLTGSYALSSDRKSGFIDAVAAAESNGLWMVDGSQQRLIKRQFPGGELVLSVPLNLVTKADNIKITYLREYKGKLYLYSPGTGLLVFDTLGNYEQTLQLPTLDALWLEEGRFYFSQKHVLGYLDLQTHALVRIPILDTNIEHLLVKDKNIWMLAQGKAVHYWLIPPSGANAPAKN